MTHVFISYKHTDVDFVNTLIAQLEEAGIVPWIDTRRLRAGDDWRLGIDNAIQSAAALIVVMTPEAKLSEYVTYEWAYALGIRIKVIPIMLKHTQLHPRLESLQYMDFTNPWRAPWDRLIERLREIQTEYQANTLWVLQDAPPIVKQLIAEFDDPDPARRRLAVERLAETNHPITREALAIAARHVSPDVSILAALKLAKMSSYPDERAIPGLVQGMYHEDKNIRLQSLAALGAFADPQFLDLFFAASQDEDAAIRSEALLNLGQVGIVDVVPHLIGMMQNDKNFTVRRSASRALNSIARKHNSLASVLMPYLYSRELTRQDIQSAIAQTGEAAIPGLLEVLQSDNVYAKRAAIEAVLGVFDNGADPQALVEVVRIVLKDEDARMLGRMRSIWSSFDESIIPLLFDAVRNQNRNIYDLLVEVVSRIGVPSIPRLLEALSDDNGDVRFLATQSLAEIGTPSCVPGLISQLTDLFEFQDRYRKRQTCDLAAQALEKIGTPEALAAVERWKDPQKLAEVAPYQPDVTETPFDEINLNQMIEDYMSQLKDGQESS